MQTLVNVVKTQILHYKSYTSSLSAPSHEKLVCFMSHLNLHMRGSRRRDGVLTPAPPEKLQKYRVSYQYLPRPL